EVSAFGILHIEGPRTGDNLSSVEISGAHALKPWRCSKSVNFVLGRVPRFGADAFSLLGNREILLEVGNQLKRAGAVPVDETALEVVRVENGIARVGVDATEKTIALKANLQRSISFDKGCYLGQETIERATSRGGLKKKMYGLRFDSPVEPGAALFLDGKEVGRVTSSVMSPRFGAIGLAILHHSAWTPGARLVTSGNIGAIVSELPYDSHSTNDAQ
ncbi:MAG TPA: glycine cleavage T C-terminal barrel domain-containing protein, partial [Candidatus Binataceae bacterium]|nr:glycine cleavage T C-terminal barrel domain-containing protein [Candidatus Binataceae bacterium]